MAWRKKSLIDTALDGANPARESVPPARGMMVTERVRLVRPLEDGGMGSIWVADHLTLGTRVAVKFVLETGGEKLRDRLSREAQMAAKIDHPHAVRTYDHGQTADGAPFIVMELLEGETLADRIGRDGALGLADARRLVSQVAQVLTEAHGLGIVHRDIKPQNIVLLSTTEELFAKVLDFGLAKPTEASQQDVTLTAEGEIVGTPVYMAPEQLIDGLPANTRSDLWGLCVVAYEALTGERPFRGRTRAALGAAMLLGRREPATAVVPTLPAALDRFFAENLDLEPAERLDSARELARTFEEAASSAPSPPAATKVIDGRLRVPHKLYGRDGEVETLLRRFEEAAAGPSRVVLIEGYGGIGKTSLVAEVHRPLAERGALFVGGKFDQFNRGTPYASLIQAFRGLARRIRADAPDVWRERIIEGVGENLRALTDIIPELEELVGPQPDLEAVPPSEARNRFNNAIERFVRTLASSEHPLVIFLDDLQWADLPSIDLITALSTDPASRGVLLIGAYRGNEVEAGHPLRAAVERMRALDARLDALALGPLSEEAVLELVSDATGGAPARVRLAVACHAKTRGNPFFLRRFLESLTEKDLLRFDESLGHWTWDLSAIQALPMTANVAEFIADEIRRMPDPATRALAVASCIGVRFDLATLASALGARRSDALEALRHALEAELVLPQTESSWLGLSAERHGGRLSFRFAHDRIRQAARSLLDDRAAAPIHQSVGRVMLDQLDPIEREQRLFEIVEHLNRGTRDIDLRASADLRSLNLRAARRALASAAFEAADGYYHQAHTHIAEDAWSADYRETLAAHVEGARAAYLAGNHERMEELVARASAESRDVQDRVSAQEVKIHALVSQQRFAEALDLARRVLAELGVDLPAEPTGADVQAAVVETLGAVEAIGAAAVAKLPACDEPRVVAALRVQKDVVSTAYLAMPELLPILASNIVRATIENGVCKESPYGFAVFALVLNAVNMLDISYTFGSTALELLDRVDDRSVRPCTLHVVSMSVRPFVEPLRDTLAGEYQAFQLGMDTGDLEYAAWGLHGGMCNSFYAGVNLGELAETFEEHHAILVHHQQLPALGCTVQYGQAIANLTRGAADPSRLVGPDYDESAHIEELRSIGFRGGIYVTYVVGMFLRFLFRDLDAALANAEAGEEFADGATATYHPIFWHQYRALSVLGRVSAGSAEAAAAVANVQPHLAQLQVWLRASAANHAHRVHLVEAEIARVELATESASELYESAIREARDNRFLHEEALGHELAGRFHLERSDETKAHTHLVEAVRAYDRWGATAKGAHLEREFEALLSS